MRTNHVFGIMALSLLLITGCGKPDNHTEHDTHAGEAPGAHAGEAPDAHAGEAPGAHAGEAPDAHAGEAPDAHAGEAPDAHAGEAPDAHAGEAPDAHAGEAPDAHAGEGEIEITPEGIKMAGITLAKAGLGAISTTITLSGEVGFNEDRLVHITPRFPGIAKEARVSVGDVVNAGDSVAVIEGNENLTTYVLKAPISGRIIEKHISPGEHVSETESVYLLADLSTVWVNLAVYAKDASTVKLGQKVSIWAVGTDIRADGVIRYVTPVMDAQTRRITARVVLSNSAKVWRPGSFVNARIETGDGLKCLVVEKEAVQIVNGETVVFISDEPNRFKPVDVTVGKSDAVYSQITAGLEPGMEYVNKGAFELKAKIVTSSLGGHAGHGH